MSSSLPNPLREGAPPRKIVEPCCVVVLGATGDLSQRKLMPALFNLAREGYMPARFAIVGFARRAFSDDQYRKDVGTALSEFSRVKPATPQEADAFLSHVYYQQGNLDSVEDFEGLRVRLESLEKELGLSSNRAVYFAIAPEYFTPAVRCIAASRVLERHDPMRDTGAPFARLILEKPFGTDLQSARELNKEVLSHFDEGQVFRIDHYLGKETVQNILAFRFANSIFEPLWSSRYVESVQITVAEEVGMPGRRAQYFDKAGMLRDVVQNHALQLLCLTAMEPPASLDAEALRDEKVRLLRSIPVLTPGQVNTMTVRSHYTAGSISGKPVPGYRDEELVPKDSVTETYVAWRMEVKNWRWAGVPFYIRAGKRLPKRATEIAILFKEPPHQIYHDASLDRLSNCLVMRIQPDEGISLSFGAKVPGLATELRPVKMDFRYGSSFGTSVPEAYERLLLDAMVGDSSLFTRADEIELAWKLVTAILDGWAAQKATDIPTYPAGTWGPQEANRLMEGLPHGWRRL